MTYEDSQERRSYGILVEAKIRKVGETQPSIEGVGNRKEIGFTETVLAWQVEKYYDPSRNLLIREGDELEIVEATYQEDSGPEWLEKITVPGEHFCGLAARVVKTDLVRFENVEPDVARVLYGKFSPGDDMDDGGHQ